MTGRGYSQKLDPTALRPGVLICQQAGGKAAMLDGSDYTATVNSGYLLTASSPEVWDTLAAHFADLMSDI